MGPLGRQTETETSKNHCSAHLASICVFPAEQIDVRLQPEQSIVRKDRKILTEETATTSHFPQTRGATWPNGTAPRQTQSRCGSNPCNVMNYAASHHFKPNSHSLFVFLGGSI